MPRAAATPKPYVLHVVSDASGNLASHLIHSVITQFPDTLFKLKYHLFQDNADDLHSSLESVQGRNSLVLHAVLDPQLKLLIHQICRKHKVDDYDLTGSLVQFISDHTGIPPANELTRLHATGQGYFKRIRAMEFTAQHDDNRRLETLGEAEIVIVGLSRVSKSPTSFFLGAKGYKVANVAISRETGFPAELDEVRDRTIAFTTRPKELYEIRQRRFSGFEQEIGEQNLESLPYYNLRQIVSEVSWAEKEFRARKYPILQISGHTVEELGSRVLTELKLDQEDIFYPA